MAPSLRRLCALLRSGRAARVLLAGLLCCSWLVPLAAAEDPLPAPAPAAVLPCPIPLPPVLGEPPCVVSPIPAPPPKAAEAAAFAESPRCNDALIEVVVGQSRILTVKEDLQTATKAAALYVGDPTIADITFVPPLDPKVITPRPAIRVLGKKVGATDLVITTPADKIYKFEVRVIPDPALVREQVQILNAQLLAQFPDARLKVSAVGNSFMVEGEARSTAQVRNVIELVRAAVGLPNEPVQTRVDNANVPGLGPTSSVTTTASAGPHVINLIRVPGSQQVLLKVRVAELDRTAMRNIGADFLAVDQHSPLAVGTSLGNASVSATGLLTGNALNVTATGSTVGGTTTSFGIFSRGDFEIFFSALRKNQLLKILAEPNLVALNGQRANFLAGGQFFIPTAQTTIGGVAGGVTATPVNFGVSLDFIAHILDGDVIRLTVDPEVSQPDFSVATTLVAGGSPVPGLNKRSAHTTVELRQGQTLAIAGLMSVTLDGTATRIPGLGDLPILGPFFSNTSGSRTEKELIVLVTPYLVEPMNPDQVPPSPGDEVKEPNDLEFYLLGRIEGRTGVDFRSTTHYDDPMYAVRCLLRLHDSNVRGPKGYCE